MGTYSCPCWFDVEDTGMRTCPCHQGPPVRALAALGPFHAHKNARPRIHLLLAVTTTERKKPMHAFSTMTVGLETLEPRRMFTAAPFTVGGDPRVHAQDFRITTFASGLNFPNGMARLSDGSILVAT